jgi:hypothetical protein
VRELFAGLHKGKFNERPQQTFVSNLLKDTRYGFEVDSWIVTAPHQNLKEKGLVQLKVLENVTHYFVVCFLLLYKGVEF